jgi:hypothetical protein
LSSDYAQINGNLDVSSNENVSGNLDANTISTRSLSSDYAQINGNLDVSGQATVGGDLGAHTLSATEDISGRDLYVRDIFARDITALSGFYGLYLQLSGDIDAQSGRFRGNVDGDSGSFNTLSIGGSSLDDYIRDIISGLSWTATCNSDGTITITAD